MCPLKPNPESLILFLSANNVAMLIGFRPFQGMQPANHMNPSSINVAIARPFRRFCYLKFNLVLLIKNTSKAISSHV